MSGARGTTSKRVIAAEIALRSHGGRIRSTKVGDPSAATCFAARCRRREVAIDRPPPSATTAITPGERIDRSIAHACAVARAEPPGRSTSHDAASSRSSQDLELARRSPATSDRGCGKTRGPIHSTRRAVPRGIASIQRQRRWIAAAIGGSHASPRGRSSEGSSRNHSCTPASGRPPPRRASTDAHPVASRAPNPSRQRARSIGASAGAATSDLGSGRSRRATPRDLAESPGAATA
ncbi:MAG: hypothetical protein FJ257_13090 [Phycisphaerae bacterium]|nr:hypothetical protein [Phycisphaerae bacterium]